MTTQPDNPTTSRLVVEPHPDEASGVGGVVWKLPHDGDLDANLVRLAAHRSIEPHRNDELDVLVVVRTGSGTIDVDGHSHAIGVGAIARVPKGAHRSITAGPDGISYLSVHRSRPPMTVAVPSDR